MRTLLSRKVMRDDGSGTAALLCNSAAALLRDLCN
jgi:hypothetical protein